MAGRKRKPTKLKLLAGNPGHRPLPQDEPQPEQFEKFPPAPRHLGKDAKKFWRRRGPGLARCGIFTTIDYEAFATCCQWYGRWVEAERALAKSTLLIKTKDGNIIQNPLLGIANRAAVEFRKCCTEFGMTPSSRARITATAPREQENPYEAFLKRKAN